MAYDFIVRLEKDAKSCLKQKNANDVYEAHNAGIGHIVDLKPLLVAWANRDAHTTNSTDAEARTLIDLCQSVLDIFKCTACNKAIWHQTTDKYQSCLCGHIKWITENNS